MHLMKTYRIDNQLRLDFGEVMVVVFLEVSSRE